MSIHGVLGESTSYPKVYDPTVLFAIPRTVGRDEIAHKTTFRGDYVGVDIWQVFELSWLNPYGVPQVAVARLYIPADSANIVESKSLKLYFNSLNFTVFESRGQLVQCLSDDLSACVQASVKVMIHDLSDVSDVSWQIGIPQGQCIDDALAGEVIAGVEDIDSSLLAGCQKGESLMVYEFYSHLLRSNCPVTNQPDWGTVQITIHTHYQLDYGRLLRYILSFREHNGFHEQCVERIFADLMCAYEPETLRVMANYTRRGGIDINPVRVFGTDVGELVRLVRQ